jgi:cell division transport system ATP-binding protein
MIVFDHVSKQFLGGSASALHDVTVTIGDGEFVFLIGPSGAGKSTFLRLILRDLVPSEGSITVNDWKLAELPPGKVHLLRRSVGMVFQDFKLLTDRTIFENVAIGLEILGKSSAEIEKGVTDVLELVGLPDKRNFFPMQLSAGELQRVSIARAIVAGPSILLADEPTGNLDPETGWGILTILKEINAMGTTIIMATHNDAFVNQMKKRTLTIHDGNLVHDEEKGKYHMVKHEKHEEHAGRREEGAGEETDGEREEKHVRHHADEHHTAHHARKEEDDERE